MRQALKRMILAVCPKHRSFLNYVHIGKCGGLSVFEALLKSPAVRQRFFMFFATHVKKPDYNSVNSYLFVVRNPVSRAISAFNWRKKLVVTEGTQKNRFPGEYDVLKKYGSLDALATALYDSSGALNEDVAREYRLIHHLNEDIAWYLDGFFEVVEARQIFAVLCQETLDADIARYLEVPNPSHAHKNSTKAIGAKGLSEQAHANLVRFLGPDYDSLERLVAMFPIDAASQARLLAR